MATKPYLATYAPVWKPKVLSACNKIKLARLRGAKPVLNIAACNVQIAPQSQLSANAALALYRFAKVGAGVAIVPAFLGEEDVAFGAMERAPPDWELDAIEVCAEWPSHAPNGGIIKLLVSVPRKIAGLEA